jgi:hypothetical protein
MPASELRKSRASAPSAEEQAIAHILAVTLDEVEGIEDRGVRSLHPAQVFKP